ncbi:hypothetical protein [Algihabitans sp.]|uniref:hypothetical protein n=1 Tax=Algihabitans sp. TaxID=2821514 RepID=UPI003BA8E6DE
MPEDESHPAASKGGTAANDSGTAATRLDAAVLTLARLIGRQMARETFEQLSAANDNRPTDNGQETS